MQLFNVKTIQSNAIRTLFEVLKDVLTDVTLIFDPSGIKIMAMDANHIALIHMKLDADKFEVFECSKKCSLGISMPSLYKLIKTINNSDTVTFFYDDDTAHELGLRIENADKNAFTEFNLKLLDIDEREITIPDVEINCVVTIPSTDFQRMCRDMSNISDILHICSNSDELIFTCEGDFAKQKTVIGEATHGLFFSKKNNESISGKFSLKYINLFTKSTNLSNTIELYLKNNYPLILKYNVANLGEIRFCLAPTANDN